MHIVQSAVLLLLLFLVSPFWNIQLKHKPFNWHHPIQCCKMKILKISDISKISKISKITDIFDIFKNIVIFSIPANSAYMYTFYLRREGYVFVGFFVCVCVCPSVCLSVCTKIPKSKSYEQILMKFCGEEERDPRRNQLDFGVDSDSFLDPGSFSRILYR